MFIKSALTNKEHSRYFGLYLGKLPDATSLFKGYEEDRDYVISFFSQLPKDKHDYRYEEGKWNPKEILQHLLDTERIFMYRCFRIARHDKTPLMGFDQNIYIDPSHAKDKTMAQLIEEFQMVRAHSISMLKSFSKEDLMQIGVASESDMSARAAAFIILGHNIWHIDIIKERYF